LEPPLSARILVNVDVPELGPAVDFYQAAVGARFKRFLDDDVAELEYGSSIMYLLRKPQASRPTPARVQSRDFARHWTPVHVDFVVADLDRAVARAAAAGATRESECIAWRGSRCVTFADPFGHGFCLIEFSGDGYE
jgi:predicted enzyme related to lactoylglutathione lyase